MIGTMQAVVMKRLQFFFPAGFPAPWTPRYHALVMSSLNRYVRAKQDAGQVYSIALLPLPAPVVGVDLGDGGHQALRHRPPP